jgi:hypothetical protein
MPANGGQTCPPIGERSWRTTTPQTAAITASDGNVSRSATSISWTRARWRQRVGASDAVTPRYATASKSSGIALKTID